MTIAVPNLSRVTVNAGARSLIRIVIVGHVDHGKSTLIGRLLHETGSLPDGKLDSLKAMSLRRGMPFEWSFLLDALQAERNQGITIDTSQIRFRTAARDVVLIDAPGHTEFLRNMITGAAQADAAVLIVDALEGVRDQTRRHGYLLHLLGIRQVAVVINKMDSVGFDQLRFNEIKTEITAYLSELGLPPAYVIPISARQGDGVALRTPAIGWHDGPTVLEALDRFAPAQSSSELDLRIPVQAIYKFDDRRIVAGRVESGGVSVGDQIAIMPAGKTAVVKSIEAWPVPEDKQARATAGQSIGITLDRELFIERGNVISSVAKRALAGRNIRARVFWLHSAPLAVGAKIVARIGTAESSGVISAITNAFDPGRLAAKTAISIGQNQVGEIDITLSQPLAADLNGDNSAVGRVVLELDGRIAGGGLVLAVEAGPRAEWAAPAARAVVKSDKRLSALASELAADTKNLPAPERLAYVRRRVAGKIVFTTSFGIEDQAILHMIADQGLDIDLATLDTGRLFPEAYDLWAHSEHKYGRRIRAMYPRHNDLEALVDKQGINGFYDSREGRLACCRVRKVEPLNRALAGANAWIAGLRGDQSANRNDMNVVVADQERGLVKLSPLFDWSREQVLAFTASNNIPINPLHKKGFVSIGCAPCTRAIEPGEPERAGRWWWEDETKKECGLHSNRKIG